MIAVFCLMLAALETGYAQSFGPEHGKALAAAKKIFRIIDYPLIEDDKDLVKEENKSEQDLQLSIAEIFGALFKTHKNIIQNVLATLFNGWIPNALSHTDKTKQKFGLYILDDMIEFLGPEILGQHYKEISQQIIKFCASQTHALRQAAAYGVGLIA